MIIANAAAKTRRTLVFDEFIGRSQPLLCNGEASFPQCQEGVMLIDGHLAAGDAGAVVVLAQRFEIGLHLPVFAGPAVEGDEDTISDLSVVVFIFFR